MAVAQMIHGATHADIWGKIANLIGCPIACGGLVWFIMGMVWRYSHIGEVCSGDFATVEPGTAPYQWKSGKFLNVYYITIGCIIGAGLCCCCSMMACAAVAARNA